MKKTPLVIIYSSVRIEGKVGVYCNPDYFASPDPKAVKVYTDDKAIKAAYAKLKTEVKAITVVKAKKKED